MDIYRWIFKGGYMKVGVYRVVLFAGGYLQLGSIYRWVLTDGYFQVGVSSWSFTGG